ncbi:MAG: tetratricopeptide repeat protein [Pseudomonadota bacterium]|jgi:tetratricopeptide (TPR) repeat protein
MLKRNALNIMIIGVALFLLGSCHNRNEKPISYVIDRMENALYKQNNPARADSLCDVVLASDSIPPFFSSQAVYVKRLNEKWAEGIMIAQEGLANDVGHDDSLKILNQLMEVLAESGRLKEAIECGITLSQKLPSSDGRRFGILCRVGDLYFDIANYDSALIYHKLAFKIAQEKKDQFSERWAANELFFDYLLLGVPDSSDFYFKKHKLDKLHGPD